MRVYLFIALLSAFLLVASGCSTHKDNEKIVYHPLTKTQLDEFISDKNINATAKRDLGNVFTVIMFENGAEMGFYTAMSDQEGKIMSSYVKGNNNKDTIPVSTGGTLSGIPFVTISINDEKILHDAQSIKVVWEDGHETIEYIENEQSNFIIPYDDNVTNVKKSYTQIFIYDKNGKVLYKG
ncbi:hypothetical protein [Ammoniphilus sp. 3BR4]|uniref:hypothetical protein n=1 Tax=Ammoniphilus sp. 3BR4 TaxID=3158265 RepID=UPI0034659F15